MRIAIVGGGPAGLYLAILMRRRNLAEAVTVYERNPPDATFGWGIVFSGATLRNLAAADPESHAAIMAVSETWDRVIVCLDGASVSVGGNSFVGVERLAFVQTLQHRATELGADIRYRSPVVDPAQLLDDYDLLIGADGVGSIVRATWQHDFRPTLDERRNWYTWLGTPAMFDGLTMVFRRARAGTFIAHAYRYSATRSTFVVECDPDTYRRAGLDRTTAPEALVYLADVFHDELQGAPLLGDDSRWIRFLHLTNTAWHHGSVALLGDAVHTAHFSIGSGTKLALEDAIALADSCAANSNVTQALETWESTRKPQVEAYQSAALTSLKWLEDLGGDLDAGLIPFAYKVMTRSGRVTDDSLRRRDPEFMAAVDAGAWPAP